MKVIPYLFMLLAAGSWSCDSFRQEVDPRKLPTVPPKLVVACFISPQDTLLTAKVARSRPVLGQHNPQQSDLVSTATVTLTQGNRSVLLSYNPAEQVYQAEARAFPIEAGKTYTLTVRTPENQSVRATCRVPEPVNLLGVELDSTVVAQRIWDPQQDRTGYTKQYLIRGRWNDPAQTANYYRVAGFSWFSTRLISSAPAPPPGRINQQQLLFGRGDSNFLRPLLTDQHQNGQLMRSMTAMLPTVSIYAGTPELANQLITLNNYHSLVAFLELLNVDEHYYQYHETLQRQSSVEGNPFAEPVLVQTNIVGGLGCFGAYSRSVRWIYLR